MIIYGAGLAGLLAGNMMRSFNPVVKEAQSSLPNNHGALLRFRSDKVETATAVPFKKVRVKKAIKHDGEIITTPNLMLSNMYSQKVTGSILDRSINNLSEVDRYIAPWHLISEMASNCSIEYNSKLDRKVLEELQEWEPHRPIISTLPMPLLMKIVGWDEIPDFPKQKIWTQKVKISDPLCEVCQTIYYPDPLKKHYRVSLIGDTLISEFTEKPDTNIGVHAMDILNEDFGIRSYKIDGMEESEQEYGKIMPIDDKIRKEFIFQMTNKHNIYSVGRFATWRQLLLDDVVDDLKVVEQFIRGGTDYARWMHSQKGENQ
jgi:hypothetical protein|tara:strand:+ start:5705 stop:6655 length:951 start_codon:yes stop_codon:yes gene_type:complete